jgi:hypothetical protein
VTELPTAIEAPLPGLIVTTEGDVQEQIVPATPEKSNSKEHAKEDAVMLP